MRPGSGVVVASLGSPNPSGEALWALEDAALAGVSLVEALELLWSGWRVLHLVPYRTESGMVYAAAILVDRARADRWAGTTVRLGEAASVDEALESWASMDPLSRRLAVGWFVMHAKVRTGFDLTRFGLYLASRVSGNLGPEEQALFHGPWLWEAVCTIPASVLPEVEAARLIWCFQAEVPVHA